MKVSFLFLRREVLVDIQQPASIKKDTSEWRTPQCIYSLRKWKKKKKENRSQELLWLYRSCSPPTTVVVLIQGG
jgi:hypothetical protein